MDGMHVIMHGLEPNADVLSRVISDGSLSVKPRILVIEDIRCYGMPIGQETLDTKEWIGMFRQANGGQVEKIPRLTVKTTLCKTAKATDANVRQALIDMYGGSQKKAVGTIKNPGPLYGVKSHIWSALAVGVTYLELNPNGGSYANT